MSVNMVGLASVLAVVVLLFVAGFVTGQKQLAMSHCQSIGHARGHVDAGAVVCFDEVAP